MITNNYLASNENIIKLKKLREKVFDITIESILTNKDINEDKKELKVAFLALEDYASKKELDKFYDEYISCIVNLLECVDDNYTIDWCKTEKDTKPVVIKDQDSNKIHFEFSGKRQMLDNALWLFDYANDECNKKDNKKQYRKGL